MTDCGYVVDPWSVREVGLDLDQLGRSESVFALSNGHIGMRGNLDEGEPHKLPGTYLNGVHELRPLPYAEAGYGYPESGQTVINVTNGKLLRLLVEDEPLDLRYGTLVHHERELDFRDGVLRRSLEWISPAGQRVKVRSTRLVSLTQRAVAAIDYEVEAVDEPLRLVIQSELMANEQLPLQADDPRAAAVLEQPLEAEAQEVSGASAWMVHRTKRSGLRVAAGMDHIVEGPDGTHVSSDISADTARVAITARVEPGEVLRVTKFIGYGWSAQRSLPALRDQVAAAITMARDSGWDVLSCEQRELLDAYWERADVEVHGDTELQQAVRFALFHLLQASARAERRAIPAKGLTGPGYDGHAFWDTETFVLQVLTFTNPAAAADALRWRHTILPQARERATQLGYEGAAFPWRTISGHECSGYWPAGTAAFHVNADIADAVVRYVAATGDTEFERKEGLELLVETARLWRSLGQHDIDGRFRIDGVTGPDEYSALGDNNVFTNLMAQRNLRAAARAAAQHMDEAVALGVDVEEMASWRDAATAMLIPYDPVLGVHPQSEGFTRHEVWDFTTTPEDAYPLLLHYPYFDLYRKQVVKQADLVLALQLCSDAFTEEQRRRNFDYYEALTTRDSSLSAATQATVAAQVGHLDLAYDYLAEAALVDLQDRASNTADGLHLASLAGTCIALVAGFAGMHLRDGEVSFAPRLPNGITTLRFGLTFLGHRLRVEVTPKSTTYEVEDGEALELVHHGEQVKLLPKERQTLENPEPEVYPRPRQPAGRAPASRRRSEVVDGH